MFVCFSGSQPLHSTLPSHFEYISGHSPFPNIPLVEMDIFELSYFSPDTAVNLLCASGLAPDRRDRHIILNVPLLPVELIGLVDKLNSFPPWATAAHSLASIVPAVTFASKPCQPCGRQSSSRESIRLVGPVDTSLIRLKSI